jgi:hypothetical protein
MSGEVRKFGRLISYRESEGIPWSSHPELRQIMQYTYGPECIIEKGEDIGGSGFRFWGHSDD